MNAQSSLDNPHLSTAQFASVPTRYRVNLLPILGLLLSLVCSSSSVASDLTPVRVQLKWFHQFQFAGFYAAQSQGYFEQAGLAVELVEGGPSLDPVEQVLAGVADFGVGNSSLVLDYQEGKPVVFVAAIFQHSPFVILARDEAGINSVLDLEGRTLMGETHAAELLVYLISSGVDMSKVNLIPHTGDMRSLKVGRLPAIHASTAYISTEPFQAIKASIPYKIFSPRDAGIDFYGDSLFTTRAYADANPDVVKAMRDALLDGWRYARQHPEVVVSDILANYPTRKDRLALTFEAHAINGLLNDELVEIGYVSTSRLKKISSLFVKAGLTSGKLDLNGLLFQPSKRTPVWVLNSIGGLIAVCLLSMVVAVRFQRLNKQRLTEIEHRKRLEEKLIEQASTDPLTGLANRRRFQEVSEREFVQARRHKRPLGVVVIDLDSFKSINDRYGHHFGDVCLQSLARACHDSIRSGDLAARMGGDEFTLLLPDACENAADTIKQRLYEWLKTHPVCEGNLGPVYLSISVGVGWWDENDEGINDVLRRADKNMYDEKRPE
ncbi:GGDEF domain-containing protein [Simiduia aestuariiviva]|uniref:diguanylate cyclase n=1 Tax=Simiduia aestuariiviva TaxID=1510459 RepID=A0A839UNR2_9GAMM|nr:GGDEF domain-containing protein [Simiduia aestuariiviva]MBB3167386.1 diguanylate cyclase (GGDEF)-like protein [Simiduia aestuariiviva]